MKEQDEIRLIDFCKGAIEDHLSPTTILKIAKAAREFREIDEYRNGDNLQVHYLGKWVNAFYIGKSHVDDHHLFSIQGDWRSIHDSDIRLKPKTKTMVKGIAAIAKRLEEFGYKADRCGEFRCNPGDIVFTREMWQYCGKEKPKKFYWHSAWLEEVEEL